MRSLWALICARNLEFIRDRSALGWSTIFPIILIMAIAMVFTQHQSPMFRIGYMQGSEVPASLLELDHIDFIEYQDPQLAQLKISRHQLDLLIEQDHYLINPESRSSYFAEQLLLADSQNWQSQDITGEPLRYVEWIMPGVIGMNMMFSALFGIGYGVVRYRRTGVLRRLHVTPVKPWQFIGAQLISRLCSLLVSSAVVFILICLLFSIEIEGSIWLLLLSTALGGMAMISIGLLVASRTRSEEYSNGILNLLSWPMMFLSGVWFSLEGALPWVKQLAEFLPLTQMNRANRAILLDGAAIGEIMPDLLALAAMTVTLLLITCWRFRWD
ncbi:ABC transporter permease [Shewanella sp. TC10]|uniref:ABC transporter permease n=1 Tax=Shewanella sp. TC10 TaxID=1419739 RepID=UPI00129D8B7B|nr:ABC transporter permease [Shewanella sp. TC10]